MASRNAFNDITAKATATQANRVILLSVGAGAGVILLARVSGTPGVASLNGSGSLLRIAIGTGATLVVLMIIAEFAPEVAMGLAITVAVGAALTYGADFARALSKGTLNPGIPKKGK